MKKKLLLGVIMLLMAAFAHAQKTYVLLTGINNYGTGKNNLNFPVNDAKDLKQIFEHQGAIVALLTSKFVTKDNINKKLDAIIKLAKPEDKVTFSLATAVLMCSSAIAFRSITIPNWL